MRAAWAMGAGLLGLAIGGCSATADDTTGGTGEGTASGGAGGDTSSVGGGFGTGGGSSGAACSSDLQSVLDDDGNVVTQCPPDQGCLDGTCVPACQAAAGSKSAIGCEYWTPTSPFFDNESSSSSYHGACYAVFVANTWQRHAKLSMRHGGQTLDVTQFARIPSGVAPNTTYAPLPSQGLPPDEVAVLFLSHDPNANHPLGGPLTCPVTPALEIDTAAHGSARANAFELVSDTPITAYDILPYGGAPSFLPSASLLFPRTAWGDNYVAYSPHQPQGGQLWMLLVGQADGTTVTLAPETSLPAGTDVPGAPGGQTTEVTLDAGEVVQWLGADPTGTVLQADQPFGLFTGNTYLRVTSATSPSGGGQDAAHQQIPPITALGSTYVGGGVVTRQSSLAPESTPYRIVGVVDGTELSYDPMPAGAPTTIGAGQVAEFETDQPFVVRSQDADHPFALSQYMGGAVGLDRPGCSPSPPSPGLTCGLGDEEWVVLVPPEQFLSRYVFFTDPTYATTNLVLVRDKGESGFSDVSLDCLGTVSGWQPVGGGGRFEVAHVDLVRGGQATMPGCAASRHEATSDGAFGVMVWGTDYYASYGYPAGGNVGSINEVVVPPTPE